MLEWQKAEEQAAAEKPPIDEAEKLDKNVSDKPTSPLPSSSTPPKDQSPSSSSPTPSEAQSSPNKNGWVWLLLGLLGLDILLLILNQLN